MLKLDILLQITKDYTNLTNSGKHWCSVGFQAKKTFHAMTGLMKQSG